MRPTIAVLDEKIDGLKDQIGLYHREIKEEIKPKIDKNTEFRQKSTAIIGFCTAIGGFLGALAMWIVHRIGK